MTGEAQSTLAQTAVDGGALAQWGSPWAVYLLILVAGGLATAVWRWAGALLARDIDVTSEAFRFAKAVSTALIAGLIARLLVFPQGALGDVSAGVRIAAFVIGLGTYFATARQLSHGGRIASGVAMGAAALLLLSSVG